MLIFVNFLLLFLLCDTHGSILTQEGEKIMASSLFQIRLGNEVKERNQIRKQLLQEVGSLINRLESAEKECAKPSFDTVRSYESMIHERCSMLARLSG
jgi:hypothetical protein